MPSFRPEGAATYQPRATPWVEITENLRRPERAKQSDLASRVCRQTQSLFSSLTLFNNIRNTTPGVPQRSLPSPNRIFFSSHLPFFIPLPEKFLCLLPARRFL
jgi:hypothetical protein